MTGRLPVLRFWFQVTIKEIRPGPVNFEPVAMQQKVVYFIRKNDLLKGYVSLAQSHGQIHRLGERDVAIIIAVNQQHG